MEKDEKIKILFIIDNLASVGGTQNVLFNLVRGLVKINYSPTVVSLNGGNRSLIDRFKNENIELILFNKLNIWFWGLPKLIYLIQKRKFSIIQNLLLYSNIIGRISGSFARVPVIISSTWGDGHTLKTWEVWLDRLTNKLDDRIVVNSKAGRDFCIKKFGIDKKKIELISNGVENPKTYDKEIIANFKDTLKIPGEKIIIGTIGRLSEEKGHRFLLDAFSLVLREIKDIFLVIVGSGYLKNNLKDQVDRLGIRDKVTFIDYLKDIGLFYSGIDIFVLPSVSEGFPNVILEAMFYQKPIIASCVGDIPEVIENGVSGLLVSPREEKELAEALKLLVRDKDLARKLATGSKRKIMEDFSLDKMVNSFSHLYKKMMSEKGLK